MNAKSRPRYHWFVYASQPAPSLQDLSQEMWSVGLDLARIAVLRLPGQDYSNHVVVTDTPSPARLTVKPAAHEVRFVAVSDFMPLASPWEWSAPLNVFLRLACYWRHAKEIEACCATNLLKNEVNRDALYWSFWLHSQNINYHPLLVEGEKK